MTKVGASVLLDFLMAIVILSGVYLTFINILPINRPVNSVKRAVEQLNSMLDEVIMVALEKQVLTRIFVVSKDKNVHCVPQMYAGGVGGKEFEPLPVKQLVFEQEMASMFQQNKGGDLQEWAITVGSDGFVRPLPVKLSVVEKDSGGQASEVVLDCLRGKLVFKK